MTRDIERRDFLALCGLGVLGAQTVHAGASEPAEDSEPVVDWDEYSELAYDPPGGHPTDFVAREYLGPAHATLRFEAYVQPTGSLSTDSLYDAMMSNEAVKLCVATGGGAFLSSCWLISDLVVSQPRAAGPLISYRS